MKMYISPPGTLQRAHVEAADWLVVVIFIRMFITFMYIYVVMDHLTSYLYVFSLIPYFILYLFEHQALRKYTVRQEAF
jgi:hypothetical protein